MSFLNSHATQTATRAKTHRSSANSLRGERCGLDADLGHQPCVSSVAAPRVAVAAGRRESGHERQVGVLVVRVPLEYPQQVARSRAVLSRLRPRPRQARGCSRRTPREPPREVRRPSPRRDPLRGSRLRTATRRTRAARLPSRARAEARSASPAFASWTKISTSTTRLSRSRLTQSLSARTKWSGSKRLSGSRIARSVLSATDSRLRTLTGSSSGHSASITYVP